MRAKTRQDMPIYIGILPLPQVLAQSLGGESHYPVNRSMTRAGKLPKIYESQSHFQGLVPNRHVKVCEMIAKVLRIRT